MADNKSNRGGQDRARLAGGQDYEVDHMARKLQQEFPDKSRAQIEQAIKESAKIPQFHNDRTMVENSSRLKLKNR